MIHVLDTSRSLSRMVGLLFCLSLMTGCRSETPRSSVTGHVSIDSRSLPQGVQVVFTPEGANVKPCVGVTNDQGLYVMYQEPGKKGIFVGRYTVSIALPGDESAGPVILPPALAGITIPKKYRTGSSELTCDVPRSGTVFDIDIATK